jgi:tetratricopeptide (TPR) repeat protein
MVLSHEAQLQQEADAKAKAGNYFEAVNLYEAALDGTASSADIHYKLALLYEDKMNDPLNALHHFKRCLTLVPTGKRAEEVKNLMKRDELALLTNLSGDAYVSRADAVRLRNENLALREQIDERGTLRKSGLKSAARNGSPNEKQTGGDAGRSYTVQPGDTLASISRKFYKSSAQWGKILAANPEVLAKPGDLKPGQTLRIP